MSIADQLEGFQKSEETSEFPHVHLHLLEVQSQKTFQYIY